MELAQRYREAADRLAIELHGTKWGELTGERQHRVYKEAVIEVNRELLVEGGYDADSSNI